MRGRRASPASWWEVPGGIPLQRDARLKVFDAVPVKRGGSGGIRKRGIRLVQTGITTQEYLQSVSQFGGTTLEQLVDGAAKELGLAFDAAQYYIPLRLTEGGYTVVDRVLFHPKVAVYIDGIQHQMRENIEQKDQLQTLELEGLGWRVVHLLWQDIIRDPLGTVGGVFYG